MRKRHCCKYGHGQEVRCQNCNNNKKIIKKKIWFKIYKKNQVKNNIIC